MKNMKRVEIEFADSNIMHGWEHSEATSDDLACVRVMGYLKSENDNQITLVMAISDSGSIFEKFTIPKGAIQSIKELRVK